MQTANIHGESSKAYWMKSFTLEKKILMNIQLGVIIADLMPYDNVDGWHVK